MVIYAVQAGLEDDDGPSARAKAADGEAGAREEDGTAGLEDDEEAAPASAEGGASKRARRTAIEDDEDEEEGRQEGLEGATGGDSRTVEVDALFEGGDEEEEGE